MKFSPLALSLAIAIALPLAANAYPGQNLEKTVKISAIRARAIALKARPGKIYDTELEKEPGGTGIRYTIGVLAKGGLCEVGIDANTGAVLENIVEPKSEQPQKEKPGTEKPD